MQQYQSQEQMLKMKKQEVLNMQKAKKIVAQ